MKREISYAEALDKVGEGGRLEIDPDKVRRNLLPVIAENRRQLKPLRDQWQQSELKKIIAEYTPDDPKRLPTLPWMNGQTGLDKEDVEEWYESQDFDQGEYSGIEFQVGHEMTDPEETREEINRRLNQTQEVSIATAEMEEIFQIEGVEEDDWESIDRWSFMIEQK